MQSGRGAEPGLEYRVVLGSQGGPEPGLQYRVVLGSQGGPEAWAGVQSSVRQSGRARSPGWSTE
jgi:hypothetical protein